MKCPECGKRLVEYKHPSTGEYAGEFCQHCHFEDLEVSKIEKKRIEYRKREQKPRLAKKLKEWRRKYGYIPKR